MIEYSLEYDHIGRDDINLKISIMSQVGSLVREQFDKTKIKRMYEEEAEYFLSNSLFSDAHELLGIIN